MQLRIRKGGDDQWLTLRGRVSNPGERQQCKDWDCLSHLPLEPHDVGTSALVVKKVRRRAVTRLLAASSKASRRQLDRADQLFMARNGESIRHPCNEIPDRA